MKAKKPADGAHPMLKFLHLTCRVEGISLAQLCSKSGVSYNTLKEAMQNRSNISLNSMEAALNAVGFTMKAVPDGNTITKTNIAIRNYVTDRKLGSQDARRKG